MRESRAGQMTRSVRARARLRITQIVAAVEYRPQGIVNMHTEIGCGDESGVHGLRVR